MTLKRLPRSFGTNMQAAAEGRAVGTRFQHTFSAAGFFLPVFGLPSDFEDLHERWLKTCPIELDVYRTDATCGCGEDDCEACESDDVCEDNTRIDVPEWEGGEGVIHNPCWVALPAGSTELGWSAYDRAHAEFLSAAHLCWPEIYQYITRSRKLLLELQDLSEELFDALPEDAAPELRDRLLAMIDQADELAG